ERVDGRIIDDFKVEWPARERGDRVDPLADHAHVGDSLRVAHELHLLLDLRGHLLAELPFLIERNVTAQSADTARAAARRDEKNWDCKRESLSVHRTNLRVRPVQIPDSANCTVTPEDFSRRVDRKGLSCMAVAGYGCCPKER